MTIKEKLKILLDAADRLEIAAYNMSAQHDYEGQEDAAYELNSATSNYGQVKMELGL